MKHSERVFYIEEAQNNTPLGWLITLPFIALAAYMCWIFLA
ncbi:MAG: hypothetical protein ACWA5L_04360 [bacterium]